jgi:hypothetical protein
MDLLSGLIEGDSGGGANVQESLSNLNAEGLSKLSSRLEDKKQHKEKEIEARKDALMKAGKGEDEAYDQALREKGEGGKKRGDALQELVDAQKRLADLQAEQKNEVQRVRVMGDMRLVDDDGNAVSLKPVSKT